MRGHTVKTPEAVRAAQLMREDGYMLKDIAAEFGIAVQTAWQWINDPTGAEMKARKQGYGGECIDCGGPTYGGDGRLLAARRCTPCRHQYEQTELRYWTQERILDAIRAWADTHGGIPPKAPDWACAQNGVKRPPVSQVLRRFPSWNDAIRQAGYEPRPLGHYGRPGEDDLLCAEIRERYEAGESAENLAPQYGCSPSAIRYRIRKAGGAMRSNAEAWAAWRERAAA